MNIESLCRRVTHFGFLLLEEGFALDAKPHLIKSESRTEKSLIWKRESDSPLMIDNPSRIRDYLSILKRQDYSYLMNDGGIVQIAFIYDGNRIARHRLLYYPCPFPYDPNEADRIDDGPPPLIDFILETFMNDPGEHFLSRSPVRFDYAPAEASDFHPASHLTINDPGCRIPVRSPLGFDTFVKFILENFYIEIWRHDGIRKNLVFRQEEKCLSAHDERRIFLNWQYPA